MVRMFRVPEWYLEDEVERVMDAEKYKVVIDKVYEELVEVLKGGIGRGEGEGE